MWFGDATIFVKSPVSSILDGLIRGVFICQVHPVNGPVVQLDIPAFYPWDAANKALDQIEATAKASGHRCIRTQSACCLRTQKGDTVTYYNIIKRELK